MLIFYRFTTISNTKTIANNILLVAKSKTNEIEEELHFFAISILSISAFFAISLHSFTPVARPRRGEDDVWSACRLLLHVASI